LGGAKRQRVRLAEDDVCLGVRLQQILRQLEAFVLMPTLAPELSDNFDAWVIR
jgi:hypothetical protein